MTSAPPRLKVRQQRRRVPHPRPVVARGPLGRLVPDLHPRGGEERGQRAHLPGEVGGHDREPRAQAGEPRDLVVVLRLRVRVGLVEQLLGRLLGLGLGIGIGIGLGIGLGALTLTLTKIPE